jgi:hypothetical protein
MNPMPNQSVEPTASNATGLPLDSLVGWSIGVAVAHFYRSASRGFFVGAESWAVGIRRVAIVAEEYKRFGWERGVVGWESVCRSSSVGFVTWERVGLGLSVGVCYDGAAGNGRWWLQALAPNQ